MTAIRHMLNRLNGVARWDLKSGSGRAEGFYLSISDACVGRVLTVTQSEVRSKEIALHAAYVRAFGTVEGVVRFLGKKLIKISQLKCGADLSVERVFARLKYVVQAYITYVRGA